MRLYYAPGACSLAAHIIAAEAGLNLGIEKVDLAKKRTESHTSRAKHSRSLTPTPL